MYNVCLDVSLCLNILMYQYVSICLKELQMVSTEFNAEIFIYESFPSDLGQCSLHAFLPGISFMLTEYQFVQVSHTISFYLRGTFFL